MTRSLKFVSATLGLLATAVTVTGCGGGSSSAPAPAALAPTPVTPTPTYVISGLVTGLNGTVVLQVNGGNDLSVTADGSATAAIAMQTSLMNGSTYAVTVKTQPSNPAQVCTVSNGSGVVFSNSPTGGIIPNVGVACVTTPLNFLSSTPATGANSVACDVAPKLTFSTALDAATVTTANITLRSGSTDQAITLDASGAQITVTPTQKLTRVANYTLTASTGIKGSSGERLASAVTVNFSCDGAWHTAALIENDNSGEANETRVAFDSNGNAIAVWAQSDGTRYSIWHNRYIAGTGWGTPATIESSNQDSYNPQVAFDAGGNAFASWEASDGTNNHVWVNRYTPSGGWGTPAMIDPNTNNATGPDLVVDANGNAIVVWDQFDGTFESTWANRYAVGSGWGTAIAIGNGASNARVPRVAVDANGNAMAVWYQNGGLGRNDIWANRYDVSTGWGTATLIETDNAGTAQSPRVKFDGHGNAIAVWYQNDGTQFNVVANRYVAGTGWGTAAPIESATGNAQLPRLAVDAAGNAIVAWQKQDGTRFNIWSNRYAVGTGWGTAVKIETDDAGDATVPWVDYDSTGNALVVWQQSDGTRTNIWSNRYTVNGWGTARLIETDNAGDAIDPKIAIDSNGNALAVWEQSDGTRSNIWANRFD